jgi:hypothetical protein
MKAYFPAEFGMGEPGGRVLRGRFDDLALADRIRMPWRFFARHMAVDGNMASL